MLDPSGWAQVIVAVVALGSAIFAGRSASGAAKYSSRTQAETEAYNRARTMDVKTIERQDKEIEELEEENEKIRMRLSLLQQDNERLRERMGTVEDDNRVLRRRVTRLERLENRLKELGYSVE